MSNRVVDVLRDFAPDLEVYSIDESFLSLEGMSGISQGDLVAYGQQIRQRIAGISEDYHAVIRIDRLYSTDDDLPVR